MNRKKDVGTLSEDAIKRMIKRMTSKRQPNITFENDQLKVGSKIIANFNEKTKNNYITDIVYEEGNAYKSIIFPRTTYDNKEEPKDRYYLLKLNDDGSYFNSLSIMYGNQSN